MAQLFDISRVAIGPRNLEATVSVAEGAPLRTSEDPEGTELVLGIMPGLADHVCLGDSSPSFGEVVADTELAHLLEHVTVELLAKTDVAGDITSGQTEEVGDRTYKITLACPDDVLVAGALSSAVWILQWAYSGGGEPEPDVEATVSGLVGLVESLPVPEEEPVEEPDVAAEEPVEGAVATQEPTDSIEELDEPLPADFSFTDDVIADGPVTQEPAADVPDELEAPLPLEDDLAYAPEQEDSPAEEQPLELPFDPEPLDSEPLEPVPAPAPLDSEPAQPAPEDEPAQQDDPWGMDGVPRPRLVR